MSHVLLLAQKPLISLTSWWTTCQT